MAGGQSIAKVSFCTTIVRNRADSKNLLVDHLVAIAASRDDGLPALTAFCTSSAHTDHLEDLGGVIGPSNIHSFGRALQGCYVTFL